MDSNVKKCFKIKNESSGDLVKMNLEVKSKLTDIRKLLMSENFISDEDYFCDGDGCFILKSQEMTESLQSLNFNDVILVKSRNVLKNMTEAKALQPQLIKRASSDIKSNPLLSYIMSKMKENMKLRRTFIRIQAIVRGRMVRNKRKKI